MSMGTAGKNLPSTTRIYAVLTSSLKFTYGLFSVFASYNTTHIFIDIALFIPNDPALELCIRLY